MYSWLGERKSFLNNLSTLWRSTTNYDNMLMFLLGYKSDGGVVKRGLMSTAPSKGAWPRNSAEWRLRSTPATNSPWKKQL
jgi:hypothetical protein